MIFFLVLLFAAHDDHMMIGYFDNAAECNAAGLRYQHTPPSDAPLNWGYVKAFSCQVVDGD